MKTRLPVLATLLVAAALLAPFSPATAADPAGPYAPVDRPGPVLRPSAAALEAAVQCHGDFDQGKEPVLLVPGTAFTVESQFTWSWGRVLDQVGIPWCGVNVPQNTLGDLTIAGEYDVYAIRKTFHLAGDRKIAIVGHSQGGMRPRYALRFWPDTRAMVADYVGVAPDMQGVSLLAPRQYVYPFGALLCSGVQCPQGVWQQLAGSSFMRALNSGQETFAGIDYSVIYSRLDGLVAPSDTILNPAPGTSYNRVAIQQVCQLRVSDHLTNGSTDAVSVALILDAITHPGPVEAARIPRSVCLQLIDPRIDPGAALLGALGAPLQIANAVATTPRMPAEAPLPSYVFE